MLLVKTYVGPSAIEGVGVFAAEPIAAGALIWRLDPAWDHVVPQSILVDAHPALRDVLERYAYPSPDHLGSIVYEVDNGRFMNHAEGPNTDFSQPGGGYATRAIAAGEEITCDYGEFYGAFELLPGKDFLGSENTSGAG